MRNPKGVKILPEEPKGKISNYEFYVVRSIVQVWTFFTTDQPFLSNSRFYAQLNCYVIRVGDRGLGVLQGGDLKELNKETKKWGGLNLEIQ